MNHKNQLEKKTQQKSRKKEILLLLVIFIVIVIVALVFYGRNRSTGTAAIVTVDGQEYGRYPLSKDQDIPIEIDGEVTNYLVIRDGAADMTEADCPDLLCVNMKAISMDGETIVCLPNKVVVKIEGETNKSEIDSMAQ